MTQHSIEKKERIGAGGIVRNEERVCVGDFMKKAKAASPLEAEIWAIFWSLKLVEDWQIESCIKSDSKEAIDQIKQTDVILIMCLIALSNAGT